jgi:hypothetical protein
MIIMMVVVVVVIMMMMAWEGIIVPYTVRVRVRAERGLGRYNCPL